MFLTYIHVTSHSTWSYIMELRDVFKTEAFFIGLNCLQQK